MGLSGTETVAVGGNALRPPPFLNFPEGTTRKVFSRRCFSRRHAAPGEVPARRAEALLRGGTLSQRPVRLHVVHLPAGLLPLGAGLPELLRR